MAQLIRYCRNCMRHTETDTIPAQTQWVASMQANVTIPPELICGYCGWSHGYLEATA